MLKVRHLGLVTAHREKRQKRKAKLAAERQGASEAGSTTSMSQDGQPGSIPLAGRAASQDALTALKQLEDAPDARRLRPNSGQGAGAHSASSTAPGTVSAAALMLLQSGEPAGTTHNGASLSQKWAEQKIKLEASEPVQHLCTLVQQALR